MTHDQDRRGLGEAPQHDARRSASPGKRTRSERLPVQRTAPASAQATAVPAPSSGVDPFAVHLLDPPVQRLGDGGGAPGDVHDAAARGIVGAATPLPFLDQIQASFGSQVRGAAR